MLLLNLGCGTKTAPEAVNIDWSILLRLKRNPVGRRVARLVLSGQRLEGFDGLPESIRVHDLRKGIPYPDASVDAVYHSHVLEHIDRDQVPAFLAESRRVLRPGGVLRIVTPDLEWIARDYLTSLDRWRDEPSPAHDQVVASMIEQCVRREASGTSTQRPLRRWVENRVLGDARQRGETHQWLWDEVNLAVELRAAGFAGVERVDYQESHIPDWDTIGLDRDGTGPYIPRSIYMEAVVSVRQATRAMATTGG